MNPTVDGMWARQSPDRCDKYVVCNDVRVAVVRWKSSRPLVVEAESGGPFVPSDAVFLRRSKNDLRMTVVWSLL